MISTSLAHEVDESERLRDPHHGDAVARQWVEHQHPGLEVRRTTTHSLLYLGPGEMTARVTAEVAGPDRLAAGIGLITLLLRFRQGTMSIAPFPDDPELPSLATMLDPRHVLRVLLRAAPELSRQLSGRAGLRCDPVVVHHPRTGACVVRYDISGSEGALRRVHAKIYPSPEQARSSALAHEAVGGRLLRGQPSVRLPRLLGLDLDAHTVLIESLGPSEQAMGVVSAEEAARVLRTLHETAAPAGLAQTSAEDVVQRVRSELTLVRTRWPDLADHVEARANAAAERLQGGAEGLPVLSHGDFTPAQLLRVTTGVVGLIDLDTLCRAEPAIDVGRFLAYSRLRQARGGPAEPTAARSDLRALVLDAYNPVIGDAAQDRIEAHERLQLALIALRAARRFKDERVRLALALLDDTPSRRPT